MQAEPTARTATVAQVKWEMREILESHTFKQAPKLGSLLKYLCGKALREEGERVTEYTIALDVFGKPENFKESNDSHVRVEIHRLRKRLAQFYQNEGAGHRLRIILPPGRYVPQFVLTEPEQAEPVQAVEESVPVPQPPEPPAQIPPAAEPDLMQPGLPAEGGSALHRPAEAMRRVWLYGLAAAGIIAAVALSAWAVNSGTSPRAAARKAVGPEIPIVAPPGGGMPAAIASVPLRLLAGYSGPPRTDGSGAVWGPDQYFRGGRPGAEAGARIARTNSQLLFQNSRIGDFSYEIPLRPGVYELHLYFVESEFSPETGHGENDRTFFLHLNEERLIPALDIESEAMGSNIAHERIFKDIHPGVDGKLHLGFESGTGVPILNAIEVLAGIPHQQLPIRFVTQPVPFIDHDGHVWQPESYYLNGQSLPRNLTVTGTPDPGMFAMERYGHFTYAVPVDVRGQYSVKLYFAEFYFGPSAPGLGGVGSRVFNVMCNGVQLLDDLDIFKEVGTGRALTKTFHHLKPSPQGKLNLMFEPVMNYAVVSAIEVLDESP